MGLWMTRQNLMDKENLKKKKSHESLTHSMHVPLNTVVPHMFVNHFVLLSHPSLHIFFFCTTEDKAPVILSLTYGFWDKAATHFPASLDLLIWQRNLIYTSKLSNFFDFTSIYFYDNANCLPILGQSLMRKKTQNTQARSRLLFILFDSMQVLDPRYCFSVKPFAFLLGQHFFFPRYVSIQKIRLLQIINAHIKILLFFGDCWQKLQIYNESTEFLKGNEK